MKTISILQILVVFLLIACVSFNGQAEEQVTGHNKKNSEVTIGDDNSKTKPDNRAVADDKKNAESNLAEEKRSDKNNSESESVQKKEIVEYYLKNGKFIQSSAILDRRIEKELIENIVSSCKVGSGRCFEQETKTEYRLLYISDNVMLAGHTLDSSMPEIKTLLVFPLGADKYQDYKAKKIYQYQNKLYVTLYKNEYNEDRTLANVNADLYIVDLSRFETEVIRGVRDFVIQNIEESNSPIVYLEQKDNYQCVRYDNVSLPVRLKGMCVILSLQDSRILLVTNGHDVEVFDLLSKQSVYHYIENKVFVMPQGYNVIFNAIDEGGEIDPDTMYFYKIFIDGVESGRTQTGLGQVNKKYQVQLQDNEFHVVKVERWKLSVKEKKYIRENNIRQPKPFRFYLPSKRVLQFNIVYKDQKYSIDHSELIQ